MAALRKFLHLEDYLHPVHFENLGKLLLMMSLLWGYFVFAERLTTWYGNEPAEMAVFWRDAARLVRAALLDDGGLQLRHPVLDPARIKKLRTITGCVIASFGVARRHVARALPDHRAVARPQVPAVQRGAPIGRGRSRS